MQHCFTIQNKMRMAVHGDDFVCLSDDDGLKHIDKLLQSKYTEDSDVKSLLLLNRVFRVGTGGTGSGCNANTKTVSTPREKLHDKLVLDGRKSPILKREDATRYRSACMRL